ncbi:16S rRNA (uracil1498-N3)-methyltransferase [Methylohalomonas lacus]|uniref:Ribosomal RNA small subunit methyltransferase E n=1 Tax=Methylohalomonas lacus TaxID=398773 RepID=A0AAE3HNL2_9GAMM|nr:16S rRNA (uracil(1498)-N(3))-methyltransferase [Methylohalomonas lacus]MCS3904439.1 16S rRNA (uracil1498-N3)-methyltransferase [Methylohalomonas lacus]
MREIRIHVDAPLVPDSELTLPPDAARHVARVLRLKAGQSLTLFNGRGGEYAATIVDVARREVRVQVDAHDPVERESPLAITLVQAVSRGKHMDYTLQKAVELGVQRIVPVLSEHGQVRLDDQRTQNKQSHWHGIIVSACEQSGRNRLPELQAPCPFDDWLAAAADTDASRLLLEPLSDRRLRGLPTPTAGIVLVSGPEGGFSPAERDAALAAGCNGIGLGPRVLRTETAAPAAIMACQALWGDLG